MKRILSFLVLGVIGLFPSVCTADYIIRLKDGKEIITSEYREEGDQIKIERYGGIIGLPKDQVIGVEETEDSLKNEPLKTKDALPAAEEREGGAGSREASTKPPEDTKHNGRGVQKKEDPQVILMKEKRRILSERESVSQAFEEAKAKSDQKEKDRQWNRLLRLHKELQQLQNQVAEENKGVLPSWWDQIQ